MKRQYAYGTTTRFGTKKQKYDLTGQRRRQAEAAQRRAAVIYQNMPRMAAYVPRTPGGLASTERKYFDSGFANANLNELTTTGWAGSEIDPATLNCLFAPSEGNGIENRVGNKVLVDKIALQGTMYLNRAENQTAAHGAVVIRILLYIDQQTNGTQAQAEDVLASGGAVGQSIHEFQNTANFGRFRVLKDKKITMSVPSTSWDGTNIESNGNARNWKMVVKFSEPLAVRFNNTNGGTVADIIDNSFHIIAAADDITTTTVSSIDYKSRVYFRDP
jgi:hypothetical protein